MSAAPKPVMAAIGELEKKLGTGATYAAKERAEILDGTVPEWIFRCRVLLSGPDKAWAEKLIEGLRKAREQLWPKVRFSEMEKTPPPAAKTGDDH
jgi:hypothetical protein